MNSVNLIGRLTKDPELRFIPGSGTAVANFILAVDKGLSKEKKKEYELQSRSTADFIRVVVWGKQAENCSQYIGKGNLVAIYGSIQTGTYKTPSGETRYITEVLANKIMFLEYKNGKPQNNDDFIFREEDYKPLEDDDDVPF